MKILTSVGLYENGQLIQEVKHGKVKCYYNLHKKVFSVVSLQGDDYGKVVYHADQVHLSDCQFVVSEAGRQRVIREQRKNVHAYVKGVLSIPVSCETQVSYNPYKTASFYIKATGDNISQCQSAHLIDKQVFVEV